MYRGLTRHVATARVSVARRPWIRWLLVAALSCCAAVLVMERVNDADAARQRWTEVREVLVAAVDHAPGDALQTRSARLPAAAIPAAALSLDDADAAASARQHIGIGEVVVSADITVGSGPAASAEAGSVVIAVSDPLVRTAPIGAEVAVYSDGIVLAERGVVVHLDEEVVFIALDPRDAPLVAAAAQLRAASIAFTTR